MNQAQAVSTSSIPAVRPDSDAVRERLQGSRRRMNLIALTASLGAMAFGLFWLAVPPFLFLRLRLSLLCT